MDVYYILCCCGNEVIKSIHADVVQWLVLQPSKLGMRVRFPSSASMVYEQSYFGKAVFLYIWTVRNHCLIVVEQRIIIYKADWECQRL